MASAEGLLLLAFFRRTLTLRFAHPRRLPGLNSMALRTLCCARSFTLCPVTAAPCDRDVHHSFGQLGLLERAAAAEQREQCRIHLVEDRGELAVDQAHGLGRKLEEELLDQHDPHLLTRATSVVARGQVDEVGHAAKNPADDLRPLLLVLDVEVVDAVPGIIDAVGEHLFRVERKLFELHPLPTESAHCTVFVEDGQRLTFQELDERLEAVTTDNGAASDTRVEPELAPVYLHPALREGQGRAGLHQRRPGLFGTGCLERVERALAVGGDMVGDRTAHDGRLAVGFLLVDASVLVVAVDPVSTQEDVRLERAELVGAAIEREHYAFLRNAEATEREAVGRQVQVVVRGGLHLSRLLLLAVAVTVTPVTLCHDIGLLL